MLKYTDDSPPLPANQSRASRRNARENVQPPLECSIIGMQIACTGIHVCAQRFVGKIFRAKGLDRGKIIFVARLLRSVCLSSVCALVIK